MSSLIATFVCFCGIAGLFYLDRDASFRTSKALWLPVLWIAIAGSRAPSTWFGIPSGGGVDQQIDGSLPDRMFFLFLLIAGLIVLIFRAKRTGAYLKMIWPIVIYFFYCLVSVSWSFYPDVSLKRWFKAIGDLVMVLIVCTDAHPVDALKRLISRLGFVLLPASLLLIKYYGELGRGYDPSGGEMNVGVTTSKNMLGVILLVLSLGALWRILALLRAKDQPNRGRHLLANCIVLTFGIVLFEMAHSDTSLLCFVLGAILLLAMEFPAIRRRPGAAHAVVAMILLAGALALMIGGEAGVTHALGRQEDLSGRAQIWPAVIAAVPNPIVGAGFESFWITPSARRIFAAQLAGWWHPENLNEAHNGYIEVYANLGWVGLCILFLILVTGYRRAAQALQRDPELGALSFAFVVIFTFFNITEAGFRMTGISWIFLLLAIVSANGVLIGRLADVKPKVPASRVGTHSRTAAVGERISEGGTVYALRRL